MGDVIRGRFGCGGQIGRPGEIPGAHLNAIRLGRLHQQKHRVTGKPAPHVPHPYRGERPLKAERDDLLEGRVGPSKLRQNGKGWSVHCMNMNISLSFVNDKPFMDTSPAPDSILFVMNALALRTGIGTRLKEAADLRQMSDAEVARRCGFSAERYGNYARNKREPDFDALVTICRVLDVTPNYLFGVSDEVTHIGNTSDHPPTVTMPEDYVPVHFLEVRPGMGGGAVAAEEAETDVTYFPPALIRNLRALPEHLRAFEVSGPSMAPVLESGDWVIVNTSDANPSQPAIFALWDGYGVVCKWVERVPNSDPPRVRILSENKRFTPYEAVLGEEAYILGRVVWYARQV